MGIGSSRKRSRYGISGVGLGELAFLVGTVLLLGTNHHRAGDAFDHDDGREAPHSGLNGLRQHQGRGDQCEQAAAQTREAVDKALQPLLQDA